MEKVINFKSVSGKYDAISSKSYSHRAIIAGSLAKGKSKILNIDLSEDIEVTIDTFKNLGVDFVYNKENRTLNINSKNIGKIKNRNIDMKNSGSSFRFLVPILMLFKEEFILEMSKELIERPMDSYFELFKKDNFNKESFKEKNGKYKVKGLIKAGTFILSGRKSSQFITGLLFSLPLLEKDSYIIVKDSLESKSYVDMTLKLLEDYGIKIESNEKNKFKIKGNQSYKNIDYKIEGDYSQASFFLAAGVLGGNLTLKGLNKKSLQGDKEIIKILRDMGSIIIEDKDEIKIYKNESLKPIDIDIKDIPDLAPILAVLISFSEGQGSLYNIERLEFKESNRIESTIKLINNLGGSAIEDKNRIIIKGFKTLKGGVVESFKDHRIIMAGSIAAIRSEGPVRIKGYEYIRKSYPNFFKHLKSIVLER